MIPGGNILNMALKVIAAQTVQYYRYLGRATNAIGLDVSSYSNPFPVRGSFQPVPRNKYEMYGLDFQKQYFTLYASRDVLDLARDISGDQLTFNGSLFQCVSKVDWFNIDGWDGVLCVAITDKNSTGNCC